MTGAALLALNAGSSSVKFALYGCEGGADPALRLRGEIESRGARSVFRAHAAGGERLAEEERESAAEPSAGVDAIAAWLRGRDEARDVVAVGHRVVHGGASYAEPAALDERVLDALARLTPLAPLHQPQSLAAIAAARAAFPDALHVACFDTAFHRTQPALAQAFALPRRFAAEGVRRYGFHGLAYEHVAATLPRLGPALASARVVAAHLGSGASLCAMQGGRSVATTMGFSPLDGLVMGTRPGALDPGVLLYLLERHGLDARGLERLLYRESGLLGVSEISSDMRVLLASQDPRAREAIDLFVYRIVREIGSLSAALGGLDAIVFSGGIGENAAEIRARIAAGAGWLGAAIDEGANALRSSTRISSPDARVALWVVASDENGVIARHTARVLAASTPG